MAILCPSNKTYCITAAITFFFFHLVSVTAIINSNRYNGGFSAHLIRRNSPNSPLDKHKNNKNFRRLLDPNTPGFPLSNAQGQGHVLKLSLGTPPTDVYVIVDTGSYVLWTQCRPCKNCSKTKYAIFDPSKSSTYKNISCYQKECRPADKLRYTKNIPLHFCKAFPTRRCPFGLIYGSGGTCEGVMAKETVTLTSRSGEAITLTDVIIGCGHSVKDPSFPEETNGILGLGRGPLSFVSQIAPYVGGNKFSYCLVPLNTDLKIESKINFGNASEVSGEGVVTTPMVPSASHYIVTAEGMTFGNEFIPFYSNVTSLKKIKMVIDSGATLTMLPQYIFDKVLAELNKTLDPKMKQSMVIKHQKMVCFNSTTIPQGLQMSFHFEGGGKVELGADEMFATDDADNTLCFGIMRQGEEKSIPPDMGIFGAVMQGNLLVGFDMEREVVSFKPTDCLN